MDKKFQIPNLATRTKSPDPACMQLVIVGKSLMSFGHSEFTFDEFPALSLPFDGISRELLIYNLGFSGNCNTTEWNMILPDSSFFGFFMQSPSSKRVYTPTCEFSCKLWEVL